MNLRAPRPLVTQKRALFLQKKEDTLSQVSSSSQMSNTSTVDLEMLERVRELATNPMGPQMVDVFEQSVDLESLLNRFD